MTNLTKYLQSLKQDATHTIDFVDTLSFEARRELAKQLEAMKCRKLVRNLFYCYKTQTWI